VDGALPTSTDGTTMYVGLLAAVLEDWCTQPAHDALVEHALTCRRALQVAHRFQGEDTYEAIAAEVSYDRSLIQLCRGRSIEASPSLFSHPREARRQLECQLRDVGVDLGLLARDDLG
jgi:hypothetical protein